MRASITRTKPIKIKNGHDEDIDYLIIKVLDVIYIVQDPMTSKKQSMKIYTFDKVYNEVRQYFTFANTFKVFYPYLDQPNHLWGILYEQEMSFEQKQIKKELINLQGVK